MAAQEAESPIELNPQQAMPLLTEVLKDQHKEVVHRVANADGEVPMIQLR